MAWQAQAAGGGERATHHRLEPLGETDRVVEGRLGRVPRVSRRDGLELVCHQHASLVSLGDAQSCRTSSISAFSSGVAWRSGKLKLGVAVESDDILALLVSAVGRVRRAVVDRTRAGWRMVRVGDTTDMCAGAYACRSLQYIHSRPRSSPTLLTLAGTHTDMRVRVSHEETTLSPDRSDRPPKRHPSSRAGGARNGADRVVCWNHVGLAMDKGVVHIGSGLRGPFWQASDTWIQP